MLLKDSFFSKKVQLILVGDVTLSSLWRLEDIRINVWNIVLRQVSNLLSHDGFFQIGLMPFETSWTSFSFISSRTGGVRARAIGFGEESFGATLGDARSSLWMDLNLCSIFREA